MQVTARQLNRIAVSRWWDQPRIRPISHGRNGGFTVLELIVLIIVIGLFIGWFAPGDEELAPMDAGLHDLDRRIDQARR